MHKINLERVKELYQCRKDIGELDIEIVCLQAARDTYAGSTRRSKTALRAREQIEQVLKIAIEVSGKPEPTPKTKSLVYRQVKAYVMAGGGMIGNFAANQPLQFYIDDRAAGGRPYPDREVLKYISDFAQELKAEGQDLNNLPAMPHFHNCGVW